MDKIKNQKSKIKYTNQSLKSFWILICNFAFCILIFAFLSSCEQIDDESLNKITQEDPSFKTVLEKKQELDSKIVVLLNQLRGLKADTYAKIRTLEENFNKEKKDIDSKITALKNELGPERVKIREDIQSLRDILSNKKEMLKALENTRRNLTNLINQQKAVNVTEVDMAKWQDRLVDLNRQIEPLVGELRELEEKLHLLRLKLIALRQ